MPGLADAAVRRVGEPARGVPGVFAAAHEIMLNGP